MLGMFTTCYRTLTTGFKYRARVVDAWGEF